MGVFNNIFIELAKTPGKDGRLMIDATHLKAHRTAASLLKKGLFPAVSKSPCCLRQSRQALAMTLTEGQVSGYKGAGLAYGCFA